MKIEFVFQWGSQYFDLSQRDADHYLKEGHRIKMQEWERPMSNSALISDEVLFSFPFYSIRCKDCDYKGDDYNKNGTIRK